MRILLIVFILLGGLSVMSGALGAHALKKMLSETSLESYKTAVLYQFLHVLAGLAVYAVPGMSAGQKKTVMLVFLTGILFFSGSIYLMSLLNVPSKYVWFITPLGGILFMTGWFVWAYFMLKIK